MLSHAKHDRQIYSAFERELATLRGNLGPNHPFIQALENAISPTINMRAHVDSIRTVHEQLQMLPNAWTEDAQRVLRFLKEWSDRCEGEYALQADGDEPMTESPAKRQRI